MGAALVFSDKYKIELKSGVNQGNGNYAYIDTIKEAKKVLVEEIGSTLISDYNPEEVPCFSIVDGDFIVTLSGPAQLKAVKVPNRGVNQVSYEAISH